MRLIAIIFLPMLCIPILSLLVLKFVNTKFKRLFKCSPPLARSLLFRWVILSAMLCVLLTPHIILAAPKDNDLQNAIQAFQKGNWALAQKNITIAIKSDPSNADVYYYQGLIYDAYTATGRKIEEAQISYDQAIKLNPRHSWAYRQKGQLYYDEGQFDLAVDNFTQAIQIEPSATNYKGRGAAYVALNEHAGAIADFNEALKLDPLDELTLIERAKQYVEVGKYREAIKDTTTAMHTTTPELIDVVLPMAYKQRALAYTMSGDKEHAVSDAQALCSLVDECTMLDSMKGKGWVK